jgi:hypothetical protein
VEQVVEFCKGNDCMTENQHFKLFQSIGDVEKFTAHTEIDAKSVAVMGQEVLLIYEENIKNEII